MLRLQAKFVKERECKHSVRYASVDEIGKSISPIIYIGKEALKVLGNPKVVKITIENFE